MVSKDEPQFHPTDIAKVHGSQFKRSLSARLNAEQGINTQALLDHKSPDMTAIYRDTRGAEWIEVKTA